MNDMNGGGQFPSIYEMLQARMQMGQFGQASPFQGFGRGPQPQQPQMHRPHVPQAHRPHNPKGTPQRESVWHPFNSKFGERQK